MSNRTVSETPTKTQEYGYYDANPDRLYLCAVDEGQSVFVDHVFHYDEFGNPTTYKGNTLEWQGRKLTKVGDTAMQYDYNGMRTRKGERYYYWLGNTLKMERWGKNTIYYYYDKDGITGFRLNDTDYYYHKNIFGDVLAIYDMSGLLAATYEYDAWGNHKVYGHDGVMVADSVMGVIEGYEAYLGNINPIRYRGYYYDVETQLFYCNSRYYSPELCRFISPDSIEYLDPQSINGLNLYCYCMNNPIMYADPSGHLPEWLSTTLKIIGGVAIIAGCVVGSIFTGGALSVVLAGAAIGATAGGIGAGISTAVSGGDIHDFANAFLMSTATGAISGAVAASPLGVGAQIGINAALGAGNYVGTQLLSGGNITLGGLVVNAVIGALCGWIGQSGWMQGQTTSAFVAFAGKNALKHVVGMVGTETLLRMTLPAFILGGVGGGIYGRLSSHFNPNGNFIGI